MQATQEKVIGGRTVAITQLPARRALKTLHRILKAIAPAAAQAVGAGATLGELKDIAGAKIGGLGNAVETLFDRLSEQEFDDLVAVLLSSATLDGRPLMPQLDLAFQGRVLELLQVVKFAIEVNYADFFDALRGRLAAKAAERSSALTASTSSSGPSGG